MSKIVEDEIIKAEMQDGVSQVDKDLVISDFATAFEKETRQLRISFTATNKKTLETVTINEVLR